MNIQRKILDHLNGSINAIKQIESLIIPINDAVKIITEAFLSNQKLLIAGNGGSAADAQHIAAEFVIRLDKNSNRQSLPALALTTDTSIITAGSNDLGFENIFSRQLEGYGVQNDVFLAISTSGNSKNLINAIETAKTKKIHTIALLGNNGGMIKNIVDLPIVINEQNTQFVQETHIIVYHLICELVEMSFFTK